VWLSVAGYNSPRGPYLIETVVGGKIYTLSYEDGRAIEECGEVIEGNLTAYEDYGA